MKKILIITAGLSEPSSTALLGEQLTDSAGAALDRLGIEHTMQTINLRQLAKLITEHYLTGFPTGDLAQALIAVQEADAIIAVTPTFKASYSGLFKSFWDLVEDGALEGTAVLVAATGGTARHSLMVDTAMRPLFSYLKARLIPTGVFAATDDFGVDTGLQSRIDRAGSELATMLALDEKVSDQSRQWVAEPTQKDHLAVHHQSKDSLGGMFDLDSVTPFEDLMKAI